MIYLHVHTDKLATTILPFFLTAAEFYGCPDVVVSDHGAESFLIQYVNHIAKLEWQVSTGREQEREAFHHTQSVHNQPVEKFWVEPNVRITHPFLVRRVLGLARAPYTLDACARCATYSGS